MDQNRWEIVILKPTSVFLSFLADRHPGLDLPDSSLAETDNTAYVIRRQPTEEATLDEIERHYSLMFQHEINRWLGEGIPSKIETSFLDFLCCFKFELHSQLVLMEPSMHRIEKLLCIKPRSVLLKWLRSSIEDCDDELTSILERVNLSNLVENATIVAKNLKNLSELKPFIQANYGTFFRAEMSRMCDKEEQWPLINTVDAFDRYFSVDLHTQVIHLHSL